MAYRIHMVRMDETAAAPEQEALLMAHYQAGEEGTKEELLTHQLG